MQTDAWLYAGIVVITTALESVVLFRQCCLSAPLLYPAGFLRLSILPAHENYAHACGPSPPLPDAQFLLLHGNRALVSTQFCSPPCPPALGRSYDGRSVRTTGVH